MRRPGEVTTAMLSVPIRRLDNLLKEEQNVLSIIVVLILCGVLQLVFGFTIPYLIIGLLGLMIVICSAALMNDIWRGRSRWLLLGVFQPLPMCLVVYFVYVNLSEALDKDDAYLATEDDLERSIQKNLEDRE